MKRRIKKAGLCDVILVFLGVNKPLRHRGNAMEPTISNNQGLYYRPVKSESLKVGDVVVIGITEEDRLQDFLQEKNEGYPCDYLTYRISSIFANKIDVRGDNEDESIDSRHFGPIYINKVLGKVISYTPLRER